MIDIPVRPRKQVKVLDTTERDGEQSPGCRMTKLQKLPIAHALADMGVDIIEGGFPVSSPADFDAVSAIASEVKGAVICGLARAMQKDIEAAARALEKAQQWRIHTFLATSPEHMQFKLKRNESEILEMVTKNVALARKYTPDVEFSPEDAGRTGLDFLGRVVEAAVQAGATTINIPDTVGYCVCDEYPSRIRYISEMASKKKWDIIISTHCHDDLGLAVSNTLAGVEAGARQVECTILGIGERAGNAHLAPVVMALKKRANCFHPDFDLFTNIDTTKLGPVARLVAGTIGRPITPNLSVVGSNAFSHGAGIHQDGVKKNAITYEIMTPEEVGWVGESFALTSRSGKHGLSARLEALGYKFSDDNPVTLEMIYEKFIILADQKQLVYDPDLHLIMQECITNLVAEKEKLIMVRNIEYARVIDKISGFVCLVRGSTFFEAHLYGDGPVDAITNAILKALKPLGIFFHISDFSIGKSEGGAEAMGLANIKIEADKKVGYGQGSDPDILWAVAKALVSAVNHLLQAPVVLPENGS